MPLISEQEIATDNGMWLIYPSHLEKVLDCKKKKKKRLSKVQALELKQRYSTF